MADAKTIANHIKSVSDTRKITTAMYLISSTKLQKAKKSLDETRPYFRALRREIGRISHNIPLEHSKYIRSEEDLHDSSKTIGIVVLTADKGLAGAYNQNVIKEALKLMQEYPNHRLYVHGEFGKHYFASHNERYDRSFDYPDIEPSLVMARQMAGHFMEAYDKGEISQIYLVYTHFKNAMTSEVQTMRLVPFEKSHFTEGNEEEEAFVEEEYVPSPLAVMENCIPVYCIGALYSVLVYSYSCEQNDRMMAMDSANQNADSLLKDLKLRYNHMRQNTITQEITEISASVKAAGKN